MEAMKSLFQLEEAIHAEKKREKMWHFQSSVKSSSCSCESSPTGAEKDEGRVRIIIQQILHFILRAVGNHCRLLSRDFHIKRSQRIRDGNGIYMEAGRATGRFFYSPGENSQEAKLRH